MASCKSPIGRLAYPDFNLKFPNQLRNSDLDSLQVIQNHEAEAGENGDARDPSEQIGAVAFAYVCRLPICHDSPEQIARDKSACVCEIVRAAPWHEADYGNINKPSNQGAAKGLSCGGLPSSCCREQ